MWLCIKSSHSKKNYIRTVVLKPVCVIRTLCSILCWTAKSLLAWSLAFLACACPHFCPPLLFPSLHSSTVGSWCVVKHMSSQIRVRADRPLASCIFGRDYDIIGQNAWFPHWNVLPFSVPLLVPTADSSCSDSVFEWNSGFPVFPLRRMVTICLSNQSNKSHKFWIYFLEILHQSAWKWWGRVYSEPE